MSFWQWKVVLYQRCAAPKIMSNLFFSNTHSHKMYSSIHPFIQHPSIHSSNIPLSIHSPIYSTSIHPYILWTNLSILSLLLFLKRNRPSFTISKHIITNRSIFHAKFVLIFVLQCFSLFPPLLLRFVLWIFVFLRIKNLKKKKEKIGEI